jgi:hypothetical protein
MKRRRARRSLEAQGRGAGERGAEIDRLDVAVERAGVSVWIGIPARAGDKRHRPTQVAQTPLERTRDVRRTAARRKENR